MFHRQALVVSLLLFVAGTSVWLLAAHARTQVVEAGFWFEDVRFDASEVEADRLGGAITREELARIRSVATSELRGAFADLRLQVTDNRHATIAIRVVQTLVNPRMPRGFPAAGESRGVWPLGGRGAVNFRLLASQAIAHAPEGTDRAAKIDAIGRGIGRAAAHELAHIIVGSRDIHHGGDRGSYEFWNADRREQYYGPMHWDVAEPLLKARLRP